MEKPVRGSVEATYQCLIEWRNGTFVTDEPERLGGKDSGPDPFTLLLSSVASCTLVTLRMYIDKQGWDIPSIAVGVNYWQKARQGEAPETTIDRDVVFTGSVPTEQQEALREVAAKCPISSLLEGNVTVRTFVARQGETKEIDYSGENVTVVWRPDYCQHSARCWTQLSTVFNPNERRWISPDGASADRVIEQVGRCPSGALGIRSHAPHSPQ
jgi:putative redox protein